MQFTPSVPSTGSRQNPSLQVKPISKGLKSTGAVGMTPIAFGKQGGKTSGSSAPKSRPDCNRLDYKA